MRQPTSGLRQELLRLVRDLLRTPGALAAQVTWFETTAAGDVTPGGRTFSPRTPPSELDHIEVGDGVERVTVYLEGYLSGSVPCGNLIAHLNGKRIRAGGGPLPYPMRVVRSATTGYLLQTVDPIAVN